MSTSNIRTVKKSELYDFELLSSWDLLQKKRGQKVRGEKPDWLRWQKMYDN